MIDILRKLHPRQVIWGLLVSIFMLIGWVGKHYNDRLEALEGYKREQNGHLKQIDVDMREMKTHILWIRETLEKRR